MIPTPKVARVVERRCAECKGTDALIGHGPRYVCVSCVRIKVRLTDIARDHENREGQWP